MISLTQRLQLVRGIITMNILLVDDDGDSRGHVAKFLRTLGYFVTECGDGDEAYQIFGQRDFQMALLDLKMPGMTGLELLKYIKTHSKGADTSVVLFTGHGDLESSIEALRLGAEDYLLKPISVEELAIIAERISNLHLLRRQNEELFHHFDEVVEAATHEAKMEMEMLRGVVAKSIGLEEIGVYSEVMQNLIYHANKYHADRDIPVLIQGETGTGKEVIAKLIHFGAIDNADSLIDLNCAAITPSLFESEMFGYEAGSFTGSLRGGKRGKIEMAAGGTLFLDEVAEMPLELQGKLLRVIQEKEFFRIGGTRKVKTDVRIICATNTDLMARVREGTFRKDLYFRLKVGYIFIPPLRERPEEILPLANHFLQYFSKQKKKRYKSIHHEAARILMSYQWPGNIRELKNTIEWIVFMYDDIEIKAEYLKILKGEPEKFNNRESIGIEKIVLPDESLNIENYIDRIVIAALEKFAGNKTKTAQYLGISRSSLAYRLKSISKYV